MVKVNEEKNSDFDNLEDAINCQLNVVNSLIAKYYGPFDTIGLPFSLGAYIFCDDELENAKGETKDAFKLVHLFKELRSIKTLKHFFKNVETILDDSIIFESDERDVKVVRSANLVSVEINDKYLGNFLRTNIFSPLAFTGDRYFSIRLENPIERNNPNIKFGATLFSSITLKVNLDN